MEIVERCLKPGGHFLLHTIGSNTSDILTNPWINKYIFPNAMVPSLKQITASAENLFMIEDLHNFGTDYDKTLMAWFHNFNKNWSKLKSRYDQRFYRMWKYFLLSSAGSFRARRDQLWQIVFSRKREGKEYRSIR
jgi:cyclopropane-fatty-acyl-phospholipid synthase